MQFLNKKRGSYTEDQGPRTTTSATARIILVIFTVVMVSVSYYFAQTVRDYITDQKTDIVLELVAKQTEKHFSKIGITTPLSSSDVAVSQNTFIDLNTELADSLDIISTMKIFSLDGGLLWSSNSENRTDNYYDKDEVAQAVQSGSFISEEKDATGIQDEKHTLGLFVRIHNEQKLPIAVIKVYFSTSDINAYARDIGRALGGVTIITIIIIYLFLYFAFRKQDNKLISKSAELHGMIHQSPVGIYTINTTGYIETYNPAMMRISGISDSKETIGKNVFDAEEYKKIGLDKLLRDGLSGLPFESEVEIHSSLGEHKRTWRHYYGVPIKDSLNKVVRLLVMVEDITVRKELESRVREYSEDLEKKIKNRTILMEEKISELKRFERLTVDRELRMIELKQEIESMRIKLEKKEEEKKG